MPDESDLILGIYIPTYNRPTELKVQLDALLPQMRPGVGVLVNDNASTKYDCASLASAYVHPAIRFSSNACNIGGNANIALAFPLMGRYRYVWILGDNDTVSPEAVQIVLEQIADGPDLVVFGQTQESFFRVETPETGWNGQCPGLISQGIYKSEKFLKYAQYGFLLHNSSFPHLAVYYGAKLHEPISTRYCHTNIFAATELRDGHVGDYSLSIAGMPVLCYLLPIKTRSFFLRKWIRDMGQRHFFENKRDFSYVTDNARSLLRKYVPFTYGAVLLKGVWTLAIKALKRNMLLRAVRNLFRKRKA